MEIIRGVAVWGDPWGHSAKQGPRGGKINIYIYFYLFSALDTF